MTIGTNSDEEEGRNLRDRWRDEVKRNERRKKKRQRRRA